MVEGPASQTIERVDRSISPLAVCAGVAELFAARKTAAAPATCGDAIDVPDIVVEQVSQRIEADSTFEPGA